MTKTSSYKSSSHIVEAKEIIYSIEKNRVIVNVVSLKGHYGDK